MYWIEKTMSRGIHSILFIKTKKNKKEKIKKYHREINNHIHSLRIYILTNVYVPIISHYIFEPYLSGLLYIPYNNPFNNVFNGEL